MLTLLNSDGMMAEQDYLVTNLQLRIVINRLDTREEIDRLCAACQEPFEYDKANNLQLNWLRVELEERREN